MFPSIVALGFGVGYRAIYFDNSNGFTDDLDLRGLALGKSLVTLIAWWTIGTARNETNAEQNETKRFLNEAERTIRTYGNE